MSAHTNNCPRIGMFTVKEVFCRNSVLSLLKYYTESGPCNGGCLVVARALQTFFGSGKLVHLLNIELDQPDHYGVQFEDGSIADGLGVHGDWQSWAVAFAEDCALPDGRELREGVPDNPCAPDVPGCVDELVKEFRRLSLLTRRRTRE
jgi:hypothetical protein